ncbi:uncharacterized protein LOC131876762 [Cryptomeria japonica]|uniref:uncharacterized protein LOC131876762 n=1 Tax=Cryptomeria japonica TaxID=3369 RepID=UPI0027D9D231|nr:uncharacterized protein LOC131876762 [Cryptomeria japonica]
MVEGRTMGNSTSRKQVIWLAPRRNWNKLNFHGASRGNPSKAGYGAVLRDEYGSFLQAIYESIGETTNNKAEIRALEAGEFEITHSYREGNKVADILANMGVTLERNKNVIRKYEVMGDIEELVCKEMTVVSHEGIG